MDLQLPGTVASLWFKRNFFPLKLLGETFMRKCFHIISPPGILMEVSQEIFPQQILVSLFSVSTILDENFSPRKFLSSGAEVLCLA